jgi:glycosyltransferase involved in cell wall biosynthesis
MNNKTPKVSIGLPIYNGEKFIKKRIENLLEQTFSDFELIISDNASTDSTFRICKEFEGKDLRIRCIKQEKNMGGVWNFNFVLKESKGEYFTWAAVDDLLKPTFLEKNIQILESKKNIVCSVSKIKMFGEFTENLKTKPNDSFLTKIEKKIKKRFSYMDVFSVTGDYNSRVNNFIKNCRHNQIFYGVYRKKILEKCIINESFICFDTAYSLSILKYGDLHVVDDILMMVFDGGESRTGMINVAKRNNRKLIWIIFPYMQFTIWCKNHLGTKLFLKNSNFFFRLNLIGLMSLSLDILRRIRKSRGI